MTSFAQIREKSVALTEQIAALRKQAAEQIKPLLQEFVRAYPAVTGVRWTQYTPHFNDGDTCTFSVHEPRFQFNGEDEGGDYDDGFFDLPYKYDSTYADDFRTKCTPALYEACQSLSDDIQALEPELQELFGDHVRVTVTSDGVEVDEYEHD